MTAWQHAKGLGILQSEYFAKILDVYSKKYGRTNQLTLDARCDAFVRSGGDVRSIESLELMAELFMINAFLARAESAASAIILDITSYPKRFFFPLLRRLLCSHSVKDLLITYTSPATYAPDHEPLYEDIEDWRVLPGFGGAGIQGAQWVVSVGFLVESLRKYVGAAQNEKMKLLIPFPAPLAALRRTWESISNLEQDQSEGRFEKFRVDTLDMSAAFERIRQFAGGSNKPLAFAPFGPKPTSAAMCLYASQKASSVHYAQPTVYHPQYSRGIRDSNPATAISAYWVKHDGENLYLV